MGMKNQTFDVVVIGAGHAGCEAAFAASRRDCSTLLLTASLDSMAIISGDNCPWNRVTDNIPNTTSLPPVIRAALEASKIEAYIERDLKNEKRDIEIILADRRKYSVFVKHLLERQAGLVIKQTIVSKIHKKQKYFIIETPFEQVFKAKTVVIATGTFINGCLIGGVKIEHAGRQMETTDNQLARSLKNLDLKLEKALIAASPRLDRKSIDYAELHGTIGKQQAWQTDKLRIYQLHLPPRTQQLILEAATNQSTKKTIAGEIKLAGQDIVEHLEGDRLKAVKIRLLPEGARTNEVNLAGLNTYLSEEKQHTIISSIPGFKKCELIRPGYAVEYQRVEAGEVESTLETKVKGLFVAGQAGSAERWLEASRQGAAAGLNASRRVRGEKLLSTADLVECFT